MLTAPDYWADPEVPYGRDKDRVCFADGTIGPYDEADISFGFFSFHAQLEKKGRAS